MTILRCLWIFALAEGALRYEFEPRRTTATLAKVLTELRLPSVETVDVRAGDEGAGGRLYVSRLNECADEDASLLYVHSGFLLEGSRHQASPLLHWMANTHRLCVYSVEYRLASRGASYAESVDDVRAATRWVAGRRPGRPLVLAGSSAGAGLLLTLAHEAPAVADLVVADSAPVCAATFDADARGNRWTRWLIDWYAVDVAPSQVAWHRPQTVPCRDDAFAVPVVVLHSEQDLLVPVEQALPLANRSTLCVARGGTHMMTLSAECRAELGEALRVAGVARNSAWWDAAAAEAQAVVRYTPYALLAYVPAPAIAAYLCLVRMDPVLVDLMGCDERRR